MRGEMKLENKQSKLTSYMITLAFSTITLTLWSSVLDLFEVNPSSELAQSLKNTLIIIASLCIYVVLNRGVNHLWWDGVVANKSGRPVPALLKTISSFLLLFVGTTIVFTLVFGRSLTGVLAVGGGLSLIIGIALQSLIADVFSGLAINIDQPFRIGDFIRLNNRRLGDIEVIGRVVSINWRTTRLEKTDGTLVVIPNNLFSMMVVTNFALPKAESRFELSYCIDFASESERVVKVLSAAVRSAPTVLDQPGPKVRVDRVDDKGVHYLVRYWIDPREGSPSRARDGVNSAVLRHLRFAGISLAYERNDIYFAPMPSRQVDFSKNLEALLSRVRLFTSLPKEGINELATALKPHVLTRGDTIVKAGEAGSSMYLITEGVLEVYLDIELTSDDHRVATMSPGDYFGEMSLITGDPRSATIRAATDALIYEIEKTSLEPIFKAYPSLPESIAQTVASRDTHRERFVAEVEEQIALESDRNEAKEKLLRQIKRFFQL